MDTRETLDDPDPSPGDPGRSSPDAVRTDVARLVQLRLEARIAEVRVELDELTTRHHAPDQLVTRFGATVADAQRSLGRDRAVAERLSAAFVRAADEGAREVLRQAEAEARLLRSVAERLRQTSFGGAFELSSPDLRSIDRPLPAGEALEAWAS